MSSPPPSSGFTTPQMRSWPIVVLAVLLALWGWTVHLALGIALTVFAIGLAFRFPDPEDEFAAQTSLRSQRRAAASRRARAATPLTPRGEIEVAGRRRPARMLTGTAEQGTSLEIVNEVDGELVVRRAD